MTQTPAKKSSKPSSKQSAILLVLALSSVTLGQMWGWAGAASVEVGTGGAVATVDVRASSAALEVLKSGGNAIDAVVAAAAVLNVTDPFSAGIGGGGFMLIYSAKDKKVYSIDSRETAPASATPTMFLDSSGKPVNFSPERITSGLAVGVPGALRGWDIALKNFGSRPLKTLLEPAIAVAENGFDADATYVRQVDSNKTRFALFPASAKLYLDSSGNAPKVGDMIKNPDLANTFRTLQKSGVRSFYGGAIGRDLVKAVSKPQTTTTTPFKVVGANMNISDLTGYEAKMREPTVSSYRGLTVYGMGTPSSGGYTVGLILNLLSGFDLGAMPREQALHTYLEASRLAYADRGAFLGDGDVVKLPARGLLSAGYANERRPLITDKAVENPKAGDPFKYDTVTSYTLPLRPDTEGISTTHIVATDKMGNIVTYTFTVESEGGSGMVVPGRGFLLNNELTDFDAAPGGPNAVAPGKRPRSSMSPTLLFKGDKPYAALGSPGGSTIITTVTQTILNLVDFKMPLDQAINAPRISQRNGSTTSLEANADATLIAALTARGQKFAAPAEIGAATGIVFNPDGTLMVAAEAVRRGSGIAFVENPTK